MNTKLEMSRKSELNKNIKINVILVLIAVSFSEFTDRRCTRFYLDKSRKVNPNCPKRNPWTTQSNEIIEKMDDSGFASSMENIRKNQKQNFVY